MNTKSLTSCQLHSLFSYLVCIIFKFEHSHIYINITTVTKKKDSILLTKIEINKKTCAISKVFRKAPYTSFQHKHTDTHCLICNHFEECFCSNFIYFFGVVKVLALSNIVANDQHHNYQKNIQLATIFMLGHVQHTQQEQQQQQQR